MKQVMEIGEELQLPPIEQPKKVQNRDWYSVILIVGKMVEGNWLFTTLERAECKYIEIITENKGILTDEETNKVLNDQFVILEKCSIFLDKPLLG